MDLPFALETEIERRIARDPDWQRGVTWGRPRPGHPEGSVAAHIADVLANIDAAAHPAERRADLRIVALVHDTLKFRVDRRRPVPTRRSHGELARELAERHLDDDRLLEVIELHDEAFNAYRSGARRGNWCRAEERAGRLLERLGPHRDLYLDFYRADNATGDKRPEPLIWFEQLARRWRPPAESSMQRSSPPPPTDRRSWRPG